MRVLTVLFVTATILYVLKFAGSEQGWVQRQDRGDGVTPERVIHWKEVSGYHSDWIWPLRFVPRSWTAIHGAPPHKSLGTTPLEDVEFNGAMFRYPPPIPPPGCWHLTTWPPYIGISTRSGWHLRIGFRYDDIDGYYSWPSFTLKKFRTGFCAPVKRESLRQ